MADHTVATDGEWNTLFANSDSFFANKTVSVSGSSITARSLSSRTFTNLTLESADASSVLPKLDLDGVTGLAMVGLHFENDNSGGTEFTAADAFYMLVVKGNSDVSVTSCTFDADCPTGELNERFGGVRVTESACPIINSTFSNIRDGVVFNSCHTADGRTATVTNCDFTNIYEDAITGLDSDWVVNDNTATMFEGQYGRRFEGTITGTISVGETLSDGGSGDAEKILEVTAVATAAAPSIVESTLTTGSAATSDTLSLGTFTAGAGSNRKVIAVLGTFDGGHSAITATADWGGEAGELIVSETAGATNADYEYIFAFQWQEANFPSGATGTMSFTASEAVDDLGGVAFTVQDTKQDAATAVTDASAQSETVDITPSSASNLVIGVGHDSVNDPGMDWTAGLTVFDSAYGYESTSTILIGTAEQGASSLTCTHDGTAGRSITMAFALQPASSDEYVEGYYNTWARPAVSDVMTGASGSITVSDVTTDFDGIHGDFFQPLMNTATADRALEVKRNFLYRTNAFGFDSLQQEQSVNGILAQLNGSDFNWSTVDISYNVFTIGSTIGISIEGAQGGTVNYNTIPWAEYGFPCDIRIWDSDSVSLEYNAGDNNSGGVIDVSGGGNTNLTVDNNVSVDGDSGAQETVYADPFSYPQTLAGFAPVSGQAVDTGDAGALTTGAEFRGLAADGANLRIAATASPGASSVTIDFGEPVTAASTAGLITALQKDGSPLGGLLTYASSMSGDRYLTVSLGSGSLDSGSAYNVTVNPIGMTRDSDGATVSGETISIHLVVDFRDEPTGTSIVTGDLPFGDTGGSLQNSGNASWAIGTDSDGVNALTWLGQSATSAALFTMSNTVISLYLASTGDTLMVRDVFRMEKGAHDGITVSNSGRLTGENPRINWGYGSNNTNCRGKRVSLSGAFVDEGPLDRSAPTSEAATPAFNWGTTNTLDTIIVRNASDYTVRWFLNGRFIGEDNSTNLTGARYAGIWYRFDRALGNESDTTYAHLYRYGYRITAWRGGGFANTPNLDQSENGTFALPAWAEDSVVALHGAYDQRTGGNECDTAIDWGSLTPTFDTDGAAWTTEHTFTLPYILTGPSGTADVYRFRRPRTALPSGADSVGWLLAMDSIGQNGYECRWFDDDGGREVGVRVDAGTGDVNVKIIYDNGAGWSEVDTGLSITRTEAWVIRLSFTEGQPLGVAITNHDVTSPGDRHSWSASVSQYTGLPAEWGTGEMVFTNNGAADTIELYGWLVGCLVYSLESSYVSSAAPSRPQNVGRANRRAFQSDGGRGGANTGFTPDSYPAGPFNNMGRGGGTTTDWTDLMIGGAGSTWYANTRAFPAHMVDGTVNRLGKNITRGEGEPQSSAEADWVDHGDENVAECLRAELEFVEQARAGGAWFLITASATIPVFYSLSESYWLAEMRDAHYGINEVRRTRAASGQYAGGYFADMAAAYGDDEATATSSTFGVDNIHPSDTNLYTVNPGDGASWRYADAVYGQAHLAPANSMSPGADRPVQVDTALGGVIFPLTDRNRWTR
jgi:hypothetical protein